MNKAPGPHRHATVAARPAIFPLNEQTLRTAAACNQPWQQERLWLSGDAYFDDLLAHLHSARISIDLETYIFRLDSLGQRLLTALCNAAGRGVGVRLLIDGIGSYRDAAAIGDALRSAGGEMRVYHPLPWQWSLFQLARQKHNWLLGSLYYGWAINRRDHRKLAIVDGRHLWSGSLNISADHLSPARGGAHWIDFGVRVAGPGVDDLTDNFERHWQARKIRSKRAQMGYFLTNFSAAQRRRKERQLRKIIATATDRVWLCNAYFAPSHSLLRALARAARRGLDVRLMVGGLSDIRLFPYLSSHYYRSLLQRGIRLFEVRHRVLHAKAALIDQTVIVGSTNLNSRSRLHDLELDLLLHQPDSVAQMQAAMRELQQLACELTPANLPERSVLLSALARLLRYWM